MRQILVESARRKQTPMHGGGRRRCDVEAVEAEATEPSEPEVDLAALDAALHRLA
jgi:hypothetical protein